MQADRLTKTGTRFAADDHRFNFGHLALQIVGIQRVELFADNQSENCVPQKLHALVGGQPVRYARGMFECRFEQLRVNELVTNPLLAGFQFVWRQRSCIVRGVAAHQEIVRLTLSNPTGNRFPGRPPLKVRHEKE